MLPAAVERKHFPKCFLAIILQSELITDLKGICEWEALEQDWAASFFHYIHQTDSFDFCIHSFSLFEGFFFVFHPSPPPFELQSHTLVNKSSTVFQPEHLPRESFSVLSADIEVHNPLLHHHLPFSIVFSLPWVVHRCFYGAKDRNHPDQNKSRVGLEVVLRAIQAQLQTGVSPVETLKFRMWLCERKNAENILKNANQESQMEPSPSHPSFTYPTNFTKHHFVCYSFQKSWYVGIFHNKPVSQPFIFLCGIILHQSKWKQIFIF